MKTTYQSPLPTENEGPQNVPANHGENSKPGVTAHIRARTVNRSKRLLHVLTQNLASGSFVHLSQNLRRSLMYNG